MAQSSRKEMSQEEAIEQKFKMMSSYLRQKLYKNSWRSTVQCRQWFSFESFHTLESCHQSTGSPLAFLCWVCATGSKVTEIRAGRQNSREKKHVSKARINLGVGTQVYSLIVNNQILGLEIRGFLELFTPPKSSRLPISEFV